MFVIDIVTHRQMKTTVTAQIFKQGLQTAFRALVVPKAATKSVEMPTPQQIQDMNENYDVVVYSKSFCPFCVKAKKALDGKNIKYYAVELDKLDDAEMNATQDYFKKATGARSVPRVYVKGKFLGGGDETAAACKDGTIMNLLK